MTGDWYIGLTRRTIEERLKEHLYEAREYGTRIKWNEQHFTKQCGEQTPGTG